MPAYERVEAELVEIVTAPWRSLRIEWAAVKNDERDAYVLAMVTLLSHLLVAGKGE